MRVLIAGDYCPQNRVAEAFKYDDYGFALSEIRSEVAKSDYSIVNLECPVVNGTMEAIKKIGPHLKCSKKGILALKQSGFSCVTLANNHFLDYGEVSVKNTLSLLQKIGIDSVGGGMNLSEASRTLFKEIEGKRLAIINCCEHEFSIATETRAGSNPLNPIQQYYAIVEAKKTADYVLVIVHGGHEMWQLPSPRMKEVYRFFIDCGADAVVNHHQHCYSGYEYYSGRPIVYGLGNFCFDKYHVLQDSWYYGYMVTLDFSEQIKMGILPYEQCGERPVIRVLSSSERREFDLNLQRLNAIISSPERLQKETSDYYDSCNRSIKANFEPFYDRLLYKLYLKGWFPSFLNKAKTRRLVNVLRCESHRDKVFHMLDKSIK